MSPVPNQSVTQVDQEMVGEPVQVGSYTIQPLARAQGRVWRAPEGEGQGVFMQLNPTAVRITDQDGSESLLPIPSSSENSILRGMAAGAAAIAGVCIFIMLAAQLLSRR